MTAMLISAFAPLAHGAEYLVYVGTYTNTGKSQGIYAYRFDSQSGKLESIGLAAQTVNPSYVTIHPNRKYLYAVSEVGNGNGGGAVAAFSIDPKTAKLTPLNTTPSRGSGPCYVSVDHTGKAAMVANYNSGSVALLPIKADGSLGDATAFVQHKGEVADKVRQEGPHAHSVNLPKSNRFMLATDLGLDEVPEPGQAQRIIDLVGDSVRKGQDLRLVGNEVLGVVAIVVDPNEAQDESEEGDRAKKEPIAPCK